MERCRVAEGGPSGVELGRGGCDSARGVREGVLEHRLDQPEVAVGLIEAVRVCRIGLVQVWIKAAVSTGIAGVLKGLKGVGAIRGGAAAWWTRRARP